MSEVIVLIMKNKSNKNKILFLINGYGLGNSTRCHAIIQHLHKDFEIDVFVYGNSLKYFKQVSEVNQIFKGASIEYTLKNGKIKFFTTIKNSIKSILKNRTYIKQILKSKSYKMIISDSQYSAVFLKNRPYLISINNANRIIKKAWKMKKKNYWSQYFIELLDCIYNQIIPDQVVSPFFDCCKDSSHIKHVPLIIRKEFDVGTIKSDSKKQINRIFIMTSGANNLKQSQVIHFNNKNYKVFALKGSHIEGDVQKIDKIYNTSHLITESDILVINGGLSSISEVLALKKPMLIIPIKGHIEQKINASWIQKNKMGLISSWDNLEKNIDQIQNNYRHFKESILYFNFINGTQVVSNLIKDKIHNDTLCR